MQVAAAQNDFITPAVVYTDEAGGLQGLHFAFEAGIRQIRGRGGRDVSGLR